MGNSKKIIVPAKQKVKIKKLKANINYKVEDDNVKQQ